MRWPMVGSMPACATMRGSGCSISRLVAASCLPQAVMGMALAGSFGPDTSLGILPKPHVLCFYACFFFFGVATFAAEGLDTRLGSRWKLLLPAAAVPAITDLVLREQSRIAHS